MCERENEREACNYSWLASYITRLGTPIPLIWMFKMFVSYHLILSFNSQSTLGHSIMLWHHSISVKENVRNITECKTWHVMRFAKLQTYMEVTNIGGYVSSLWIKSCNFFLFCNMEKNIFGRWKKQSLKPKLIQRVTTLIIVFHLIFVTPCLWFKLSKSKNIKQSILRTIKGKY